MSNLSEEEKIRAIEYIKNMKNWWWDNSPDRVYSINKMDIEQFDIVLNYISELEKENEENRYRIIELKQYINAVETNLDILQKENKKLKKAYI